MNQFEQINKGFNKVFRLGKLSLGIVIPIENYAQSPIPALKNHLERVQLVEKLGFKALWVRDVPLHVSTFGDAGQAFDPFTYLGYLAGKTSEIALGIASIALPLHHPVHIIKSATTIDQLSEGRLIMGIASGDRPTEYPAMAIDFEKRGELFREAYRYIKQAQEDFPIIDTNYFGYLNGAIDVLPKPFKHKIPLLITGHSQQSKEWIAQNGDGWMSYPKNPYMQELNIKEWRSLIKETQEYNKPFMQPLYIDLHKNDDLKPQGIHLGFRLGANYLVDYFYTLLEIGVNHVAINLRFNSGNIEDTLEQLAHKVLPYFHINNNENIEV